MPDQTEAETILAAAHKLGEVQTINGVPIVVRRNDMTAQAFSDLMDAPQRISGAMKLLSLSSFLAYLNRHAVPGQSIVTVDRNTLRLGGVIDFHEAGTNAPHWCSHKVGLQLNYSRQLTAWMDARETQMNQATFASFLEEHIGDIHSPTGAEMLTIAGHLEATKTERFVSSTRLANGDTSLTFTRETNEQGSTKVPTSFKIAVQVFDFSTTRTPIEVLLRHRITGGQLVFHMLIPTLEDVVDVVWADMLVGLNAGLPGGVDVFDA